jgi:bacterial/archaeal transporter family-2 protein
MSRPLAIVLTVVAGLLVGLQPPANAALSRHVGDFGAALLSAAISSAIIGVVLLLVGEPGRLSGVTHARPEQLLGGLAGAVVVTVSLVAVRPLGAGAVVALLVAAQIVISVVADRLGWFGLHHVGLDAGRLLGVLLVIAGTVLVTRG